MKTLNVAASLLVLSSASALAFDLPSIKSVQVVAPAPTWTDFYAGLNAGGTWGNNNSRKVPSLPLANGESLIYGATLNGNVSSSNASGFIGSGQVGYNWQVPYQNINVVTGSRRIYRVSLPMEELAQPMQFGSRSLWVAVMSGIALWFQPPCTGSGRFEGVSATS
jgi:hypothetical protein